MNSTIQLYDTVIAQIEHAQQYAVMNTAESLHTDLVQSQTMPRAEGTLQNESTFVDDTRLSDGKVSLVSSTPYARRLYYHPEYHFNTEENPYAQGEWLKPYLSGDKKDYIKQKYASFLRQQL